MSANDPDFIVGAIGVAIVMHLQEPDPADPTGATLRDMDVSAATLLEIDVLHPDDAGAVITLTAVFATANVGGNGLGTDGRIMGTTVNATQLPIEGDYVAQAYVEFGASPRQRAAERSFSVGRDISA